MHQQTTTKHLVPDTVVLGPRHPADELSSCRLVTRNSDGTTSLMVLPEVVDPSLGHLGMLADVSTAQALTRGLKPGTGIRTLSLQLHLAQSLTPGELVCGKGTQLSLDDIGGLSQSILTSVHGTPLVTATGRFVVVREPYSQPQAPIFEPLDDVPTPQSWDTFYGVYDKKNAENSCQLTAVPSISVRNHGPMMHGGMQVRALEIAMAEAAGVGEESSEFFLSDISVTYHRPVPVDGHSPIMLKGKVVRRGRRTLITSAAIETPEGRLLSSAEGIYLPRDPDRYR